ncbi:MAG: hypothetical protein ACRDBM_04515 [Sporomusa sp.]
MWDLYDELIAEIPRGIPVDCYNVARNWTTVRAGGNMGVSLTVKQESMPRTIDGPYNGM